MPTHTHRFSLIETVLDLFLFWAPYYQALADKYREEAEQEDAAAAATGGESWEEPVLEDWG